MQESKIPTFDNATSQAHMDSAASLSEGLEWLHQHTNFPTFAEFSKNPDKWRARPEELFESIDGLNVEYKNRVKSIKYFWRGKYECSLGKIYDIAKEEGVLASLEMEPKVQPMDGSSNNHDTRLEIQVNVWPKDEFRSRGGIVANDT